MTTNTSQSSTVHNLSLYLNGKATKADCKALLLARLGFPYKTIARETGLTEGQIAYRLSIAGISPRDYRNGDTSLAQRVIAACDEESREFFNTVMSNVRRYLKDR